MAHLVIDTIMRGCSAALFSETNLLGGVCEPMIKGHAEALVPMIEGLMADAQLDYSDLESILVTTGPGTFAGQRIGLSVARGLSLACGAPAVGVTGFEAIGAAFFAHHPDHEGPVLAVYDARRDEAYTQLMRAGRKQPVPHMLSKHRLQPLHRIVAGLPVGPLTLIGTGAAMIADRARRNDITVIENYDHPDATAFGHIACGLKAGPARLARPLYLRAPDAKLPRFMPRPRGENPQNG